MLKIKLDFKVHIKKYIISHELYKKNHNSKYNLDDILDVDELQ